MFKNRKKIIATIFLASIMLTGCGAENADLTLIDEQISSFIKNSGENEISFINQDGEQISDNSYEIFEKELYEDIPNVSYEEYLEILKEDPELMTDDEKLPEMPGFKFGNLFEYEIDTPPDFIEDWLGLPWYTEYVQSRDPKGDYCSVYFRTFFPYKGNNIDDIDNMYYDLLSESEKYFGKPIHTVNTNKTSFDDLLPDQTILYVYKLKTYYVVSSFYKNEEDGIIEVDYCVLSTEIAHSEKDEFGLINLIKEIDNERTLKVIYDTKDGNFIL